MARNILEIRELEVVYDKAAVDHVSFEMEENSIFGLVGESGCGKTTLSRAIAGLVKPKSGDIIVNGINIRDASRNERKEVNKNVQIVFQNHKSSLNPKMTIERILEEPLRIHKFGGRNERVIRVNEVLNLIGLDESYGKRFPSQLSGGQRQRVALGVAIMLNPWLIIADEPVSSLDSDTQTQILDLMKKLHEKLGISWLLISHDLRVVYDMCSNMVVMYKGRIVERGTPQEIYSNPQNEYTKMIISGIM